MSGNTMKGMDRPVTYSISDLASEFDVTTRTIRFYEEKGLLNPRREGTRRQAPYFLERDDAVCGGLCGGNI